MKTLIVLLTLLGTYRTAVQILDCAKTQLITIHHGQASLQDGTFKLIHVLELHKYGQIIDILSKEIQTKILGNSTSLPVLLHDIKQMKNQIKRIKHKVQSM